MGNETAAAHIIADALKEVANALDGVAISLKYLGNGDASTAMGAIEGLSVTIKEAIESAGRDVACALESSAERMRDDE